MGSFLGSLGFENGEIYFYSFAKNTFWGIVGDIESFSDNFTANVNSEAVYGRIDPIKTYSGTTREISFSIKLSDTIAKDNFGKVIQMASSMYPVYNTNSVLINNTNILKAPPLYAIKCEPLILGNFTGTGGEIVTGANTITEVKGMLPGFITSFGVSYNTIDGVEVNTTNVPREITLNFSFSPLHDIMGGSDEKNDSIVNTHWPFPGYKEPQTS